LGLNNPLGKKFIEVKIMFFNCTEVMLKETQELTLLNLSFSDSFWKERTILFIVKNKNTGNQVMFIQRENMLVIPEVEESKNILNFINDLDYKNLLKVDFNPIRFDLIKPFYV
jgi:hypothetical protein